MNKKKIFATILCGVFGLSIASGALVANFADVEEPTVAAPDATRLYVIPGDNWSKDGADIAAWIYGGGLTDEWHPLEPIEGLDNTNILATDEIPNLSNATNVIFGRFAPDTNDNGNWKWNESPMWNRSQGGDYAIRLNIATHNIYRIDNGASGSVDESAWGFTGGWLDFMYDDDLVNRTREIGVKFVGDDVNYDGETLSWYGNTTTNGDQIYAMSGTLTRDENGLYVGEVSCALDNIVFQNGDGSLKTNDLQLQNFAKYAQSDQLPLYTITENEGNMWIGSWGGNGSVHAPTTDYARLWYSHGDHYASGYLHTLHYWKSNGVDVEVLPTEWVGFGPENNKQYLTYFDVKLEDLLYANIQFKIYNNTTGAYQTSTEVNDGTVYSTGNNAHIYYLYFEGTTGRYSNNGGLNDGLQVTGEQLAKVFEAYYTCKNDADNGFANIETLKTTWHVEGATGLDSATINDYADGDTSYAGGRNNPISVQDKIDAMVGQLALADSSTSPAFFSSITSDSQTIIIVVIALTAFASIVALVVYSIRRRKQETNR